LSTVLKKIHSHRTNDELNGNLARSKPEMIFLPHIKQLTLYPKSYIINMIRSVIEVHNDELQLCNMARLRNG